MWKVIVEMEMPKCCWECACCDSEYGYCAASKKPLDDPNDRPVWCPIKAVLPEEHGDLIDRDAVKKEIMKLMPRGCMTMSTEREPIVCTRRQMLYPISHAKAVVKAEGKDDEQADS